jgi:Tfp pilus assembly protein PilO
VCALLILAFALGWQKPWYVQIASAQAQLQMLNSEGDSVDRLSAARAALLEKIPGREDGLSLNAQLLDAAGRVGISITKIQMGNSYTPKGSPSPVFFLPVVVEWTGSWEGSLQFLHGLYQLPRTIANVQFELSNVPAETSQGQTLFVGKAGADYHGRVQFDALWYRKGASVSGTTGGTFSAVGSSRP